MKKPKCKTRNLFQDAVLENCDLYFTKLCLLTLTKSQSCILLKSLIALKKGLRKKTKKNTKIQNSIFKDMASRGLK